MEIKQYLFVLNVSEDIEREVTLFKQELCDLIGLFPSRHSTPHITIGTVVIPMSKEQQLLMRLGFVADQTKPVPILLDGFGCFEPHTVYVRLLEPQHVRILMKECENAVEGLIPKGGWYPKAKNPHLTIGRGLGEHFDAAKRMFANRAFTESCEAGELIVLKRPVEGGTYKLLRKLAFNG